MADFKVLPEHLGNFKINSEEHGFNTIVIAGPSRQPDICSVGRLVQVRKKSGAYGSDTILIRQMDGDLMSWHNQGFFSVNEEYAEYYESLFKDLELDNENTEYSIQGKHYATGFVIDGMDCTDGKSYTSMMTITVNKE